MNEEAAVEALDLEPTEPDNQDVEETELNEDVEGVEAVEEVPEGEHVEGYISKEAWIAQGKDPDNWRSPEVYEERGKWIGRVEALETSLNKNRQDTDLQISNLNQLHRIQLAQTVNELESKRDAAIEDADPVVAKQIQTQLDQIKPVQQAVQYAPPEQPIKDPAVAAWELKNPWVLNPADRKTPYVQQQFLAYQKQGYSMDQALAAVDKDLSREFPQVNLNRQAPPAAEARSKPGGKRNAGPKTPAWDDLTRDERNYYDAMPDAWGTKADYLKAVANSRKAV